jgi:hypothetical protein
MRPTCVVVLAAVLIASCGSFEEAAPVPAPSGLDAYTFVDLTHAFNDDTIY